MAEMNLFRPFEPALDNASEGKLYDNRKAKSKIYIDLQLLDYKLLSMV